MQASAAFIAIVLCGCTHALGISEPSEGHGELTIAMTVGARPGGFLRYDIVVENRGVLAARNVVVTDMLPAGATFSSAGDPDWSCELSDGLVTCAHTKLEPSESSSFGLDLFPDETATSVDNTATVTSDTEDRDESNNSVTVTASPTADLRIAVTGDPEPVAGGGSLEYVVAAANGGPFAVPATVTITAPPGLTVTVEPSGDGWSCAAMTCTAASLRVGNAPPITLTARVPLHSPPTLSATVSSSATDIIPMNNTASYVPSVFQRADLAIAITDDPDPVAMNAIVTYTIGVTNLGPTEAFMTNVADTLPAGMTFVGASGSGWSCTANGPTVGCSRSILPLGAAPPIAITARVMISNTTVTNTATVWAMTPDPVTTNNAASVTTTVPPSADLSIAMTDSPDPVSAGGTVTYSINVQSSGPDAATNVAVTATLPPNATPVTTGGPGWTCSIATQLVSCSRPTLAIGTAPPITLTVTAPTTTSVPMSTTASVAATTSDPVTANNSTTTFTQVVQVAPPSALVCSSVSSMVTDTDGGVYTTWIGAWSGVTAGTGGEELGILLPSDEPNTPTIERQYYYVRGTASAPSVLSIGPSNGGYIPAQILTLQTDAGAFTVYMPSMTTNDCVRTRFYVATNGSTYHSRADHDYTYSVAKANIFTETCFGQGVVGPDLTPSQAMVPQHLARAAP